MHFLIDPIKPFYKTADIFLNEIKLTTDESYLPSLLPSIKTINSFIYNSEISEEIIIFDSNQTKTAIADFYFRISQLSFIYDRKCGDLLVELSFFAGIWSSGYVILMFIVSSYNRNYFINSLSNRLYNYPSQKKKKKEVSELKTQKSQNFDKILEGESPGVKSFSHRIFEKIAAYLNYDIRLKISFWKMWKFLIKNFFFLCKIKYDEKEKLMKKSEESLMEDLDICNILKKLQEIEKIKDLLFTQEQQTLLSFTPKPEIFHDEEKKVPNIIILKKISKNIKSIRRKDRFFSKEITYDSMKHFEDLILAWKVVKNIENQPINENLLRMFGEEIPKIIDFPEEEIDFLKRRNGIFSLELSPIKMEEGKNISYSIKKNKGKIRKKESLEEIHQLNKQIEGEKSVAINEKNIVILDEDKEKMFTNDNNHSHFDQNIKIDQKLYENLIEINQNISKICKFSDFPENN